MQFRAPPPESTLACSQRYSFGCCLFHGSFNVLFECSNISQASTGIIRSYRIVYKDRIAVRVFIILGVPESTENCRGSLQISHKMKLADDTKIMFKMFLSCKIKDAEVEGCCIVLREHCVVVSQL